MMIKRILLITLVVLLAASAVTGAALGMISSKEEDHSTDTIRVTPNGERRVSVEYRMEYLEEGATALYNGTEPLAVTVTGSVDSLALGTYLIKYTASHNGITGTA